MSATPGMYRAPFISQRRKDTPPYEDCALESGLMLLGSWTLGEGLVKADGDQRPLYELSETLRKRIDKPAGGLTLADVDEALHTIDPDLPPLPRYPGQSPTPSAGATLRLTFDEFKALVIDNHAAILLGYQTDTSTVGHAIHVARGNAEGPVVMDPWERRPLSWGGARWTWKRLREFTERKVGGDRFGSPTAIACAVVKVGSETEAQRAARKGEADAKRLAERLKDQKAQTTLALNERDDARRELAAQALQLLAAQEALAACQSATPTDCNETLDRALMAEQKVADAIAVLTR